VLGEALNFRLRGHHSSMYPVQLPPGLPRDVIETMISTFQAHLLSAICVMMDREETQHRKAHRPSNSIESNSGLSVASNVSGEELKPTIWERAVQHSP